MSPTNNPKLVAKDKPDNDAIDESGVRTAAVTCPINSCVNTVVYR